jgi:hypothetical protein
MSWGNVVPPTIIVLAVLLIVVLGVGAIYFYRMTRRGAAALSADAPMALYIILPIVLIIGLGLIAATDVFSRVPEIQLGLLVVIAIIALITLLFIVAAGFAHLQLADKRQALGLPDGSIRAMIALILVLVFIIFGIYLFRLTGTGYETGPVRMTLAELTELKNISFIERRSDGDFNVWLRSNISDDGARLAQQLLTTVGTLVVAVAGFYFGSSAVRSAAAAVRGTMSARPTIDNVDPTEGQQGSEVSLTIRGRNFRTPRVRLARGSEEILATDIMANATKVTARVKLEKPSGGDNWDLVVENEDGTTGRLAKAFKINPP